MTKSYLGMEIAQGGDTPVRSLRSVIKIIDRSGSMGWTIHDVVEDCCRTIDGLNIGEMYSFGWFSSPGQFDWALRGYKVAGPSDRDALKKLVRANGTVLGTTCFSGILDSLAQVIVGLQPFGLMTHLLFMTDGHPVVPNVPAEIRASLEAMGRIAPLLSSCMVIGYSDYCNKPFLMRLAEVAGGQLVQASTARELGGWFDTFSVQPADKRVTVRVPTSTTGLYMGVQEMDGAVVALAPNERGEVEVQPGTMVFYETSRSVGTVPIDAGDMLDMGWYALALGYLQRGDVDVALDVLQARLGDVYLAGVVGGSWTNAEMGRAENELRLAATNVGMRFKGGRKLGMVVAKNAFCLLDLLDVLAADPAAKFFPYSDEFDYHRIGPKSVVDGDWPKFEADKEAGCPISSLVWHDARLNLSVSTRIPGTVALRGDPAKFGFAAVYPTFIFRTYALVKDGHLNVDQLPVEVSQNIFMALLATNIVVADNASSADQSTVKCLLDLTAIPLINRQMSEGDTSAESLAQLEWLTLQIEGRLKAYNALRKRYVPEDERQMVGLTADQEAYLATNGIGKNGYSVPVLKAEGADVYTTKELTLTFKGFSSLPSLADVEKRREAGKDPTPSAVLVMEGLARFEQAGHAATPVAGKMAAPLAWLDAQIAEERKSLRVVRREIQATKFKVVLARRRFAEFNDTADEHHLTVGLLDCRVLLKEVEVAF